MYTLFKKATITSKCTHIIICNSGTVYKFPPKSWQQDQNKHRLQHDTSQQKLNQFFTWLILLAAFVAADSLRFWRILVDSFTDWASTEATLIRSPPCMFSWGINWISFINSKTWLTEAVEFFNSMICCTKNDMKSNSICITTKIWNLGKFASNKAWKFTRCIIWLKKQRIKEA